MPFPPSWTKLSLSWIKKLLSILFMSKHDLNSHGQNILFKEKDEGWFSIYIHNPKVSFQRTSSMFDFFLCLAGNWRETESKYTNTKLLISALMSTMILSVWLTIYVTKHTEFRYIDRNVWGNSSKNILQASSYKKQKTFFLNVQLFLFVA